MAGVIAAAFIHGLAGLMAVDPERWRSWERPMFTFGLGATGTLGGYLAWTSRRRRPRLTRSLFADRGAQPCVSSSLSEVWMT